MMNERKKLFCRYYITNYSGTESYHLAYPNASHRTCQENGSKFLRDPEVKAYIAELRKDLCEELHIDAMRIAQKLAEIAFSQKGDEYYNAPAQLKALDLLQKQFNLQAQKVEVKQDVIEVEVK